MAKIVTMISGGEVDRACSNCRRCFLWQTDFSKYKVCPGCGEPLEVAIEEHWEVVKTEDGYTAVPIKENE